MIKKTGKDGIFGGALSSFIISALLITDENKLGLSYSEIVDRVHENFEGAKTGNKTVAWYVASIKSGKYKGYLKDSLPEKRARSKRK